jgi:hypothetical protein
MVVAVAVVEVEATAAEVEATAVEVVGLVCGGARVRGLDGGEVGWFEGRVRPTNGSDTRCHGLGRRSVAGVALGW